MLTARTYDLREQLNAREEAERERNRFPPQSSVQYQASSTRAYPEHSLLEELANAKLKLEQYKVSHPSPFVAFRGIVWHCMCVCVCVCVCVQHALLFHT